MILHADAHSVLTRWAAPDREQERLRLAYLDHLEAHPDATSRDCHPDHLTASALIFSSDHERVLLTLHHVIKRWLQTGGHCDPEYESMSAAALREACEESGIDGLTIDPIPVLLSRHEVPKCGPIRPSHHLDVQYVAIAPPEAQQVISDESDELEWFTFDELPADTDHTVQALIDASRARLHQGP